MEDNSNKNQTEMTLRLLIKAVIQEHGEFTELDKLIRALRGRIGFESCIIPPIGMIRIRSIASEEISVIGRGGEGR